MSTIRKRSRLNQRGIGSLLFTFVMMIVISLIVLGFAQLARRGARESLDNQLSSQAYYAAESGVNDIYKQLSTLDGGNWVPSDNSVCNSFTDRNLGTASSTLAADSSGSYVKYTCALVDESAQSSLVYTNVSQSTAQVVPIHPQGTLNGLQLKWYPSTLGGSISGCDPATHSFPTDSAASYSCPFPVLRLDMLQVPSAPFNATSLQHNTMTVFLQPKNTAVGSAIAFSTTAARISAVSCTVTVCTATINFAPSSTTQYVLHVSSLYGNPSEFDVLPLGGGQLADAQAVVDVTGKAQDVLRRIKVRIPIGQTSVPVAGAIVSNQSICKRFTSGDGVSFSNTVGGSYGCP